MSVLLNINAKAIYDKKIFLMTISLWFEVEENLPDGKCLYTEVGKSSWWQKSFYPYKIDIDELNHSK